MCLPPCGVGFLPSCLPTGFLCRGVARKRREHIRPESGVPTLVSPPRKAFAHDHHHRDPPSQGLRHRCRDRQQRTRPRRDPSAITSNGSGSGLPEPAHTRRGCASIDLPPDPAGGPLRWSWLPTSVTSPTRRVSLPCRAQKPSHQQHREPLHQRAPQHDPPRRTPGHRTDPTNPLTSLRASDWSTRERSVAESNRGLPARY